MGVRCGCGVLVGGYVGVAASAVMVAMTAADVATVFGVGDGPGVGVRVGVGICVAVPVTVGGMTGVAVGSSTTVAGMGVDVGGGRVTGDCSGGT
jgi:hypothetical protein